MATTLSAGSCGFSAEQVENPPLAAVQNASDQIDATVANLQNASASWQNELNKLESNLSADAKKLIDNDIQNLISRTVNHAGVEFRCDSDFVNHRVAEALIGIKDRIMGKPVPALEPEFCSLVPEYVDMKLVPSDVNVVTIYGYNFDTNAGYRLVLEDLGGATHDVSRAISVPTAYAMTLSLGPSGVTLNGNSAKLDIYWKDRLISTVGVIQPQVEPKVCQSSVTMVPAQTVGPFIPPLIHGDQEFAGHGPTMWSSANLTNTSTDITLHLQFRAKETVSDWTEVAGGVDYTIYHSPAGQRIDKITGPTSISWGPVTEGAEHWANKEFDLGTGGLFNRLVITGDQDGNDAGRTGVFAAVTNPVQIVQSETGDCVSPTAISGLLGSRFLSQGLTQALSAKVASQRAHINQLAGHVVLH